MIDITVMLVALLFLGMGMATLVKPALLSTTFGSDVTGRPWRNEIRAVYGGFGIAIAFGLVLVQTWLPEFKGGLFLAIALALLGMAFGRLIGFLLESGSGHWTVFYFILEIAGGITMLALIE